MSKDIDIFINCDEKALTELTDYLSAYGTVERGQYGSPRYYPSYGSSCEYIDIVPFYNFIVADTPVTTVEELLHNFDFSANALACNIKDMSFYNPENGIADIRNKILRAIHTYFPEKKVSDSVDISTNTVLWFRLLHYCSWLGFAFDQSTERWIIENSWRYDDREKFSAHFFEPVVSSGLLRKILSRDVY